MQTDIHTVQVDALSGSLGAWRRDGTEGVVLFFSGVILLWNGVINGWTSKHKIHSPFYGFLFLWTFMHGITDGVHIQCN
jgi:hypothetical protein